MRATMAKRLARTGYESMSEWDGSAWMRGWGGCATEGVGGCVGEYAWMGGSWVWLA